MKPSQLATFLTSAINARLPLLVTGAPGLGKSMLVAQAAAAVGADLILSHPAVADPTDAKGLPWVEKGAESATFLPFGDLHRAITATKPTVWFLDDLGQAPAAVQASYMQLLLARCVNGHKLPDCVTFVAATNRRTDRAGVTGILEPVKSRFAAIVELEHDLDEWCQWALAQDYIPPELVAFLRFRPDLLCDFKPSADLSNSPLPRTWANAGRLLSLGLPSELEFPAVAGAVGQGAAVELMSFLRMYRELPSIDGILMDPDAADIPGAPATLYAVSTALASRTNEQNFPRVTRYAQRLMDANKGEFASLLLRDAVRRNGKLTQTAAFVALASGDLGQLMSGDLG